MKELALLLMVFWPGEAPEVEATLQKAQILWQDAQAFWNAMLGGNSCALRASLNRLLRDLGARSSLAQGNCQCSSCLFAIGQCAVITPDCATPCLDDPTKYCLYCVSSDREYGRQLHEIGRFDSGEQWQQALEQQIAACGCTAGPGQPAGDCGTLYYRIKEVRTRDKKKACCTFLGIIPLCKGPWKKYEGRCEVVCDRPCRPDQLCVRYITETIATCQIKEWEWHDCSPCCEECGSRPNCGCDGTPTGEQGKCVKTRVVGTEDINEVCNCVG